MIIDSHVHSVDLSYNWARPHGEMRNQLHLIERLDLVKEEKEKILGENIGEALGLD